MRFFEITIINRKRHIKIEYIANDFSYKNNILKVFSFGYGNVTVEIESEEEILITEIRRPNER